MTSHTESIKEIRRAYLVDDHGQVRRIPRPFYDRLVAGNGALEHFANKDVRFVDAVFGLSTDGRISHARAFFPVVRLDAMGRRDQETQEEERRLMEREAVAHHDGAWAELYRAQRMSLFRWHPTEAILAQLRDQLPHAHQR